MVKFLSFIGVFLVSTTFGQTFRNVRVLKEEEKIIITYDLIYDEVGSKIVVSVLGSLDNFAAPLTNIRGDIGVVLPGPNKRIEWSSAVALKYQGNLTFQFKGDIIHGWRFTNPDNGKMRRGKKYTLKWTGGLPTDTISLKFISPGRVITEITTGKNNGTFKWSVPKGIKTGRGYALRLSKGKEVYEQQVFIKRKTPLVLVAIPIAGAAIFFGFSNTESSGPGDLPDAPKPN